MNNKRYVRHLELILIDSKAIYFPVTHKIYIGRELSEWKIFNS